MKNKIWGLALLFFCFSFIVFDDNGLPIASYQTIKTYNLSNKENVFLKHILPNEKVCVLVFHSINCPFNLANQPKMSSIIEKFSADSVTFLYVNSNPFENQIKEPLPELETFSGICKCPYLLDFNNSIKKLFDIKKNGTILVVKQVKGIGIDIFYNGPIDDSPQSKIALNNFLEIAIQNALQNTVSNFNTVETGCRILNH